MVEHPLREREVVGSNSGRATPKALKWYWSVATLLGVQHYKANTGILLLTNIAQLCYTYKKVRKKKKSDNNQCLYSPEDRVED